MDAVSHDQVALMQWDGIAAFHSLAGPGYFPEHAHPEVQVSVRIRVATPGRWYPVARSASITESLAPHGGELDAESEFVLLYVQPDRLNEEAFDGTDRSNVRILGAHGLDDAHLAVALAEVYSELQPDHDGQADHGVIAEAMALWAVNRLLHVHSDLEERAWRRVRPLTARQLRHACGMFAESLFKDGPSLAVDEIAAELHLGTTRFAKSFRASVGVPPHRYLMRLRVRHARRLLTQTSIPIVRVALQCGFASQSHMTEHVRRFLGTTPLRLRRAAGI